MTSVRSALFLVLTSTLSLSASLNVWAQSDGHHNECRNALGEADSRFTIIPSDRVPSRSQVFAEYAKELTEPGGILEQLDIPMTGQIIEFLQGRDLQALTSGSSGGYPVAFYLDGASILRALQPQGGHALEVVYPSNDYQHGFYRDDNAEAEQISIIDHVVGHNNFAFMSGFPHYRAAHGLLASRELDNLLSSLYSSFDKDQVQRYYLWSMTLSRLVDWYTPYYQNSKEFEPKVNVTGWDPLGRTRPEIKRHPKSPTENILPAFAANIAPHQPEWKRRILDLFHDSMAFRPALVHTQVMNEGWASIMQEILPRYSKNNHHLAYWLKASRVMQGEGHPNLRDPYSLGVFAWRRIRVRFEERSDIKALETRREKDRAFIRFANREIISRMDDQQFLRYALDQHFVDKHNLAIVRKAKPKETDPNLPRPQTKEPVAQWIVVSRNAEKVVQSIIDMVIKPKYMFNPRIKLVDFTRRQSGEVDLVIDDDFGNTLAIDKKTVGGAMYALTQVIDKSASLECMLTNGPIARQNDPFKNRRMPFPWEDDEPVDMGPPKLVRARIVVTQQAELKAYIIEKEASGTTKETYSEPLTKELAGHLKNYVQDVYLEDLDKMESVVAGSQTHRELTGQFIIRAIEDTPYASLLQHAPNAAGAILEYKRMLDRRLATALDLAARSSKGIQIVGGTPRVKALPSPVYFQFDSEYAELVKKSMPGAPVDRFGINKTFSRTDPSLEEVVPAFGEYEGENGQVGGISGNPGDRFWGPDQPTGEEQGTKPGEDPNDPSWVDVPPDLYSAFLGERVSLPRLNPKPGLSRVKKTKPGKRMNRMQGEMLPMEIISNAHMRGYEKAIREGRDPDDADNLIEEGLDQLQPRDWVVRSRTITRKPEVKAVVEFILDASGSTAKYMEAFKRFVHDVETLITAKYRGTVFRYIIFDTQAHVMKDKNAFFRAALGGGTKYETGIKKGHELYQEYPRSSYDRFAFLMGDMEDFSPDESYRAIMNMIEDSEYFGVVAGLHSQEITPWLKLFESLRNESVSNPQLGLTVLDQDGGYRIQHIREVLKNDDEGNPL